MRKVVTTHEVAHLWAHKAQSEARNSGKTFYFYEETIYSYGGHFPIAKHAKDAQGRDVVLFTTASYSVTTSGHKSDVRSAIPASVEVYLVSDPSASPERNFRDYQRDFETKVKAVADARTKRSKAKRYTELEEITHHANKLAEGFGLAERLTLPDLPGIMDAVNEIRAREAEAERLAEIEYQRQQEIRRAELAEVVERWKNGENVYGREYYHPETFLRVHGGEVQTSRGASFPVSHAVKALRIIDKVKETGNPYQRNGHTVHLGHYDLDSIDAEGNVVAGCHYVPYAEIERVKPAVLQAYENKIEK